MLRQSLIIAAKDTLVFLKDWFGLGFALLFPLMFVLGFSLALRNIGPGDERLTITVATQEEEGVSHQIIGALAEESIVDLTVMEYGAAVRAVEDGDIGGFVAFPADFTSDLQGGLPTKLEVVAQIGDPETEAAILGFANAVAVASSNTRTAVQAIVQLAGEEALPQDMAAFGRDSDLLRFETEQIGPVEAFNAGDFTVPGYLTMFVFFAAALAAEAITRERANHTMERLMANGTRRESVVVGKYLGSVYRGAMQLAVLWGVGLVAFRIDLGFSPATVIMVSVLMVLTSAALGVL
ncbi:MAG: ABC transporter permease, partial [bacterium]|nr:ABC transporter permease [bacterium]